jgi:hypothetical protein
MPNPRLYLHETITIVGTGSEAYKRHTGEGTGRGPHSAPLVGTFQQSGSTGAWPVVVNLWEMDSWDAWGELLEYQYAGHDQPPDLKQWWRQATEWRSGGFDRILEPTEWSPARGEVVARGVRGRAVLQEIATLRPGAADAYLEAVARRWLPETARWEATLLGAYRTAMRDTEAVLLWVLPDFRAFTRLLAERATDPAGRAWLDAARTWRTDFRETLLVPSRWCVVHPEWSSPDVS